jgi:hypothetical protein
MWVSKQKLNHLLRNLSKADNRQSKSSIIYHDTGVIDIIFNDFTKLIEFDCPLKNN